MELIRNILLTIIITTVQSQLLFSLEDASVSITSTTNISVISDASSPFYPTDFFITVETSSSLILSLESSNIVKVLQKNYPNAQLQTFTDYALTSVRPFLLIDLKISQTDDKVILTSYKDNVL